MTKYVLRKFYFRVPEVFKNASRLSLHRLLKTAWNKIEQLVNIFIDEKITIRLLL